MFIKDISLIKWGDSYGLRMDDDILRELNIEKDPLTFRVEVKEGQIILTPKKEYPQTLDDLFADYEGTPLDQEDKYDWGESVGQEIL
jgi:antitoxin MazE